MACVTGRDTGEDVKSCCVEDTYRKQSEEFRRFNAKDYVFE